MSISAAMGSHWFVCGVRLFCGLQSRQWSKLRLRNGYAQSNVGRSPQRGARAHLTARALL
jgi:hypothetical protein